MFRRTLLMFVSVAFLCCLTACADSQNADSPSAVKPDAESYGEPVNGLALSAKAPGNYKLDGNFELELTFKNCSEKGITIGDWRPYDVSLYIVDAVDSSTSKTISWNDQPRDYDKHYVAAYSIAPGGRHSTFIKLNEGTFSPPLKAGQKIVLKCAYSMAAKGVGGFYPGWTGKVVSNPVTITVTVKD